MHARRLPVHFGGLVTRVHEESGLTIPAKPGAARMSGKAGSIVEVALPVPLRRGFDYLLDEGTEPPEPGTRVRVPFGRRRGTVGIVLGRRAESRLPEGKLRRIAAFLDEQPLFGAEHLALLRWAADYYQHPIGEVVFASLPSRLRQGAPAMPPAAPTAWRITPEGLRHLQSIRRAPRREAVLRRLVQSPDGIADAALAAEELRRPMLEELRKAGYVERFEIAPAPAAALAPGIRLNDSQAVAVAAVAGAFGRFQAFVLNGVTGSGKTEVYLELAARVVACGRQALILVPEIGLTPQLIERVGRRIPAGVAMLHSALPESERLAAWLRARDGKAAVILGTRSAIWTPLCRPGIVIVDEEHDASYKQQDALRYSARDVAVVRARDAGVPIVLGSATPALESLHNVRGGRYTELRLPRRAGAATPPEIRIVDLRRQEMHGALSRPLVQAIDAELRQDRQVLLFLNRRGYSPVIMCHACGWTAACPRCGLALTFHKQKDRMLCHHCGSSAAPERGCPDCGGTELLQVGHGTERLSEALAARFPNARLLRVDRDSTRGRGAMDRIVRTINAGEADILIGTQMLAKGHHFPKLTLVGIIDADRGLFSADFRASERMAQLFVQVSGRAGRENHPGRVLIQTHHPEHALLLALIRGGYEGFAATALEERREAELPPFTCLALLRAEHFAAEPPIRFLEEARDLLGNRGRGIQAFGPVPAPMERKAGRYRFQLLLQAGDRPALARALRPWTQ
ncbi:MAG TPA: primosomal protein N', partial [Gammaproteobacteria bacterium]